MPIETISRYDFRGALSRQRRQQENELLFMKNVRAMEDGSLRTRNSTVEHLTLPEAKPIWALFGRTTRTTGLHLYSVVHTDGVNDTLYDNGSVLNGTAFGSGAYTSIATYKDVVFFSNGISNINYYEQASILPEVWGLHKWGYAQWGEPLVRVEITGSPTPPKGKYTLFYKDRCYVASADGNLYWSNAGMFATLPICDFPALNFQTIGSSTDPIIGLAIGEDFLLAFTSGNYQIMTGVPGDNGGLGDMAWQIYSAIGCTIPSSIAAQGSRVAFIGADRRIYELSGSVLDDLDKENKIREYLRNTYNSVTYAVSVKYVFGELWIRLPKAGNADDARILVYSRAMRTWSVFEGLDGIALAHVIDAGRLFQGTSAGVINELESTSGVQGEIDIGVIGRQEVAGSFRRRKKYYKGAVLMDLDPGDSVSVSYSLDNAAFEPMAVGAVLQKADVLWGAGLWGAAPWRATGLSHGVFRPKSRAVIGRELRLKIEGTCSPGSRILNYDLDVETIPRDDIQ